MDVVAFPRSHTQLTLNDPVSPNTLWRKKENVSPLRRQFTISMPWPPKANDRKRQTFLPDIQGNARHSEKKIHSMSFLTKQQSSVHAPLIKRQNSLKSGINSYNIRSDSAQSNDVTDFSRTFQTLNDNKNLNTPIDRLGFKPIQRNVDIKCEPRTDYPIHSLIPGERRGPLNQSTRKHFRIIRVLYNTMASLKLDNRQELASNDHARHHNKRQQQWIRSEQVKNWRRSSVNKASKKTGYTSGSSSGQKSDVISGNSDDTIHTTSSQGENNHIFENPMDAEMKESFHKCLKWMENLPEKFSGMHIFTPSVSD
ncbi:uncharacterized protein LOC134277419 [Saccostrea cucullata]|uniref:uncharacterized protein LOC134277419 n=1 Tax=Saccostrea cuccullata TaxID=36930 RepID=UPI002ED673BB